MASSTVILKIIRRNTGIVAGSYVRDDELLERLRFSKNLIQVILLKTTQKAAKIYILPRIMQRVNKLTVFSNATFIL